MSKKLVFIKKKCFLQKLYRLWEYVKDDGGRIDEQIDKFTGAQASAQALTWSYANIIHSLHIRNQLKESLKKYNLA